MLLSIECCTGYAHAVLVGRAAFVSWRPRSCIATLLLGSTSLVYGHRQVTPSPLFGIHFDVFSDYIGISAQIVAQSVVSGVLLVWVPLRSSLRVRLN